MAVAAALSLFVLLGCSALQADPAQDIERGSDATAEALDDAPPSDKSFEAFAVETLRRLNDGASSLADTASDLAEDLSESASQTGGKLRSAWDDTLEKFSRLHAQSDELYAEMERKAEAALDRFNAWLEGKPEAPDDRPAPQPGGNAPLKGSGPPIRV